MKIYTSLDSIDYDAPVALALGNFDGVHKGHQALISETASIARRRGIKSAVFTFTNHPANVIAQKTVVKNIMDFDEKAEAIRNCGVDYLVSVDFDKAMRESLPEAFCRDILAGALKAEAVACGFNFSFAYKAQGTPDVLKHFGLLYGYETSVMEPVYVGGEIVSSTVIRKAISEGRVSDYINYTGRPYDIEGMVIQGRHLGRRIGFPTVNLALSCEMVQPRNGVYITKTLVNTHEKSSRWLPSITNVGNKPSVGIFDKNAETHIFGFNEDIYGEKIKVEFIKMMRLERKFPDLETLQARIHEDCLTALAYHSKEE